MPDATEDVSYERFTTDYPEFAENSGTGVPMTAVTRQLEMGNISLSRQAWGKFRPYAVELWAAHYLALRFTLSSSFTALGLRSLDEVAGVAQSQSASNTSLSESRTNPAMLNSQNPFYADMARTEYGMEFLSLMHLAIPPGGVVLSPDTSESIRRALR